MSCYNTSIIVSLSLLRQLAVQLSGTPRQDNVPFLTSTCCSMASGTFEFIAETGDAAGQDAQTRRKVRSYVMKRVRQSKKLETVGACKASFSAGPQHIVFA